MKIEQFIEKAIKGGWNDGYQLFGYIGDGFFDTWNSAHSQTRWTFEQILLDPLAWKAVGKVEGWTEFWKFGWYTSLFDKKGGWRWVYGKDASVIQTIVRGQESWAPNVVLIQDGYLGYMHRMIDALADRKSIEDYLESL